MHSIAAGCGTINFQTEPKFRWATSLCIAYVHCMLNGEFNKRKFRELPRGLLAIFKQLNLASAKIESHSIYRKYSMIELKYTLQE